MTTRTITAEDGVRLAYDISGPEDAPVLFCLAGLTRNRADFDPVVTAFGDRARILRMDYRGRGASDHADPASYTIPQEAADALCLLDHLGIAQATILGTSRGGLIALTLAALAPERLAGVIFNDIGPEIAPEGLAYIMEYLGKPPRFRTLADAAEGLARHYADAFQDVPPETWAAFAQANYREAGGRLHLRYDPRLREAVAPAFAPDAVAPDLWPLFEALSGKPLGLIRGAHSNILTRDTAAEMRRRRPDMAFAEVPKRGHVPFLDEPEAQAVIGAVLGQVA
jgi:pimeloyl-ACP methyl ester carboxylesterase